MEYLDDTKKENSDKIFSQLSEEEKIVEEALKIKKDSEYINELENNHTYYKYHIQQLEYENQKTEFGEAVLASTVKPGDFVNLYSKPCIVKEIMPGYKKQKSIWILGRNLVDMKDCDIVIPQHELIEKLITKIYKGKLMEVKEGYAYVQIPDLGNEKLKKIEIPSSEKESKLSSKIFSSVEEQKIAELELIEIMGKMKISRVLV
jgi:hypothetical protein